MTEAPTQEWVVAFLSKQRWGHRTLTFIVSSDGGIYAARERVPRGKDPSQAVKRLRDEIA